MALPAKNKPLSLIRSLFVSFVLSGILLLALSFLLYKLRLSKNQIQAGVYIVYGLACLAGGFLTGKQIRIRRFLWGGLSGVLYFAVLLALSLLLNQGIHSGLPGILISLAVCAGAGLIGGMLS